jgi:hypothetical protein
MSAAAADRRGWPNCFTIRRARARACDLDRIRYLAVRSMAGARWSLAVTSSCPALNNSICFGLTQTSNFNLSRSFVPVGDAFIRRIQSPPRLQVLSRTLSPSARRCCIVRLMCSDLTEGPVSQQGDEKIRMKDWLFMRSFLSSSDSRTYVVNRFSDMDE